MADETKYYNRLINCIDPGKDAKITTSKGQKLTQAIHGDFIVENIVGPLFHPEELKGADRAKIMGVGDNKEYIEQRINSVFILNDLPKLQINRVKFTDTGFDPRTDDMHIAHDAGTGPEKLFKEYTLVLTPASILDPAKRDRLHQPQVNGLSKVSALSQAILNSFALSDTIENITFTPGRDYSFNMRTSIEDFDEIGIIFNHAFKEQDSDWCAGNATKNQFLFDNWHRDAKLTEIQFYFLMKLLGDTLQVAWLKQIINERGLDKSKTAICTSDTDVWLRSIINGVSSVFTKGAVSTFYPVASSDASRRAAEVLLKQKYISDLRSHNEDAIASSIEVFIGLLDNQHLRFYDRIISPENRVALSIILRSALVRLRRESSDIVQRARAIFGSMADYKKFIDSHRMQKPFRVNPKTLDVTILTSFTSFFPSPGATNNIRFNNKIIYTRLTSDKPIDDYDLGNILIGIPVVMSGGAEPWVGKGGSPDSFENIDDISDIMRKAGGMPGLLSYIVITYFPELMFISYAYSIAFNYSETAEFDILFDNATAEKICAPFKRILNDNTIEYDIELISADIATIDKLMYDMCLIGGMALQITSGKPMLSVFDYAYRALLLFTTQFLELTSVSYRDERLAYVRSRVRLSAAEMHAPQAHLDALNIYGELVDAEISLVTLNKRDTKNPIAHRLYLKTAWEKHEQDEVDKFLKSRFVPLSEVKHKNSGGRRGSRSRARSHSRSRSRSGSGSRRSRSRSRNPSSRRNRARSRSRSPTSRSKTHRKSHDGRRRSSIYSSRVSAFKNK